MTTADSSYLWRERLIAYAPLLFWIAVIFYLSSSFGSFSETSRFIGPLLHYLFPDASPETLRHYHGLIRKAAHVGVYSALAFLSVRALTLRRLVTTSWLAIISLLLILIVASLDEINQSFLSSRTGTPQDVLIDLVGGLMGLIVGTAIYSKWQRGSDAPPAEPSQE